MNTPGRTESKEKRSSHVLSLSTPPDSSEELSPSLSPSSSTCSSLSQPVQSAIQIIKSRKYDYDPQTHIFIFRMPTGQHDIFTGKVVKEIEIQLQRIREDTSRPDIAALASSIECCFTTNIKLRSGLDQDYPTHSPDTSFQRFGARYPSVIIETSFSQKKKDLPRLADDYIIGSHGNIKLVVGLDIEYRKSKRATVSVWQSKKGFEEDGTPYLCAEKITDDEPFRNDDLSLVSSNATLTFPLSTFAPPGTAPPLLSPDSVISIPYVTLYSFLNDAEHRQQQMKELDGSSIEEELLPGTQLKRRQMTPEEQLEDDDDEALFVASEEKAERKAYKEDGTWRSKKAWR